MMKRIIKRFAAMAGVSLVEAKRLEYLQNIEQSNSQNADDDATNLLGLLAKSCDGLNQAQLYQDLIVLLATGFKQNGFFVEFGATNGIDLSNTYLLERRYGWKGILAEPAKVWHDALSRNRDVDIDFSCVWKESNQILEFSATDSAEFSTISSFSDRDTHAEARKRGVSYDVQTISLEDLLKKHNAPQKIDYLSIDTEGSEFEILSNFDFDKYDISIITCEHNYTADREKIFALLNAQGFTRKFTGLSKWDDWYFKESVIEALR